MTPGMSLMPEKLILTPETIRGLKTLPETIAQVFRKSGDRRRFFICSDIQRFFDSGALLPIHARSLALHARHLPASCERLTAEAELFERWFNENFDLYTEGKL